MPSARAPRYDLTTAVDVLTTGTYSRLPSILKDFQSAPPVSDSELTDGCRRLDSVLSLRLADAILPAAMRLVGCGAKKMGACCLVFMLTFLLFPSSARPSGRLGEAGVRERI